MTRGMTGALRERAARALACREVDVASYVHCSRSGKNQIATVGRVVRRGAAKSIDPLYPQGIGATTAQAVEDLERRVAADAAEDVRYAVEVVGRGSRDGFIVQTDSRTEALTAYGEAARTGARVLLWAVTMVRMRLLAESRPGVVRRVS